MSSRASHALADTATERAPLEVIWHDLECGGYRADLALWRELAAAAVPPGANVASVLDLGAGTGRVTLDLAAAGHRVTALDISPTLLGALVRRAAGLPVRAVQGDVRRFELGEDAFDLCLVPMQTLQLLRGEQERRALFACAAAHLREQALMACAIVDDVQPFDTLGGELGPAPDRVQLGERLYLSRPLRLLAAPAKIRIERERVVLPAGSSEATRAEPAEHDVVELERVDATELWAEAQPAGLRPEPSRTIAETGEHSASEVVMLRA
jgi:SAM-dependent methyltransferase